MVWRWLCTVLHSNPICSSWWCFFRFSVRLLFVLVDAADAVKARHIKSIFCFFQFFFSIHFALRFVSLHCFYAILQQTYLMMLVARSHVLRVSLRKCESTMDVFEHEHMQYTCFLNRIRKKTKRNTEFIQLCRHCAYADTLTHSQSMLVYCLLTIRFVCWLLTLNVFVYWTFDSPTER